MMLKADVKSERLDEHWGRAYGETPTKEQLEAEGRYSTGSTPMLPSDLSNLKTVEIR